MPLLPITHPRYLKRLAKILNGHESVYHRTLGRIIAGRWSVPQTGGLFVKTSGGVTFRVNPNHLCDGYGRDICASRAERGE